MSFSSIFAKTAGTQKKKFTTVVLSGIPLHGTEVPNEIAFGGPQKLAVHDLYGGGRNIQSLGAVDDPIEIKGFMIGSNAMAQARALNNIRLAGKVVPFLFSGVMYQVVVAHFKPVYKQIGWIPFTIRLLPLSQTWNNPSTIQTETHASFFSRLVSEANSVRTWWTATITSAMSNLQTIMNGVSDLASLPAATVEEITSAITSVQSELNGIQASVENTLVNITTLGGILPNNPAASSVTSLSNQINAVTTQYQAENLSGTMEILSDTLANAGTSSSPLLPLITPEVLPATVIKAPVTVLAMQGDHLEEYALEHYGDATQWPTIATANGLTDPLISETMRLVIPSAPAISSGGLLIPSGVDTTWELCPV